MLTLKPEAVEALKARYPLAVERLWEVPEDAPPPDSEAALAHTFDHADGVRLTVSREVIDLSSGGTCEAIHVAASAVPNTVMYNRLVDRARRGDPQKVTMNFRTNCEDRFRAMSGLSLPMQYAGVRHSGGLSMMHWYVVLPGTEKGLNNGTGTPLTFQQPFPERSDPSERGSSDHAGGVDGTGNQPPG